MFKRLKQARFQRITHICMNSTCLLRSPLLIPICMPKEISLSRPSATNSYNCNVPLNLNVPPFFKIGSTGGLYRGPLNRSQKMEA